MSLQVWLTGNNSMNNQGLLGELTQTTAPTYVDGKLGKAMSTGGYKMTAEQTEQVLNNESVSICFWIYINADDGTTDNRAMFFGNGGTGSNNNRKFSLFNYPTVNDFHWSWMNDGEGDNAVFAVGILSGVLPSYQWTHVAVTYQNPNGTVYINGEKVATFAGVSNSSTFAYETQVIHNSSYLYWNDYRIYNHCISAKEVKEISKGLVCHYPLKSQYETGQVNKYSSDVAEGWLTGGFTRTKLEGERGYNYKFSYTGTGGNTWVAMNAGSSFSFTAGKKYYYSCKVRCHSKNFNMALRASRSDNDWVTNMTYVLNPDGEWHEYVVSQTINSTYDRAGSTLTCNPILEFYTDNLSTSGYVYSADFDIKDVQVVESDCYVPFIDNDMVSNVVSDCSGYGNNGTQVGMIAWSGDSARYSGSYDFNGTGYIKNNSFNLNATEITISFWVKIPKTITSQHFLFGTFNDWTSNGIGYWRETNNSKYEGILRSSAESSHVGLATPSLTADIWYHIVIVYTGTECILYVNGTENKRVTYGKNGTIVNPVCYLGNSLFNGTPSSETDESSVSDFRVYATALSAEDIKSLYNVSASIDKTGVLFCGEVMEN